MKRLFKRLGSLFLFGAMVQPTNAARVVLGQAEPDGLRFLHAAATIPEAEMLRQVLTDAGFHIEHVAAAATGAFGINANSSIYVRADQYEEADAFLREFLSAEPIEE